jgi:hypothetical protein
MGAALPPLQDPLQETPDWLKIGCETPRAAAAIHYG